MTVTGSTGALGEDEAPMLRQEQQSFYRSKGGVASNADFTSVMEKQWK
jgi:hypothetical protein